METSKGVVVIHLPEVVGENDFQREWRISEACEQVADAADKELLAGMYAALRRPAPANSSTGSVPQGPASVESAPPAGSPLTIAEEGTGGAATPARATTPLADSFSQVPPISSFYLSPFPEERADGALTPKGSTPAPASPAAYSTNL